MKTIQISSVTLLTAILLTSCTNGSVATPLTASSLKVAKADKTINAATVPQLILTYVSTNYPNVTVLKTEIENNGNYEIKLSNDVELIFDSKGIFLGIDNDKNNNSFGDVVILPTNLSTAILNYITANYAAFTITHAELENNGNYEVLLSNNAVLVFNTSGTFIGTGSDKSELNDNELGSSKETIINASTLMPTILSYITKNYPIQTIIQAEVESNGNFEVTLNNGIEVYFNAAGAFIKTGNGDDNGDGIGD